jgi:hypothetical protein
MTPRPPSASSAINSATTPRSAPRSSASRGVDRKPLPHATAFGTQPSPCASAISRSMTCSREPATANYTISINSHTILLREEGFSRLPRRADDERPPIVKPEIAAAGPHAERQGTPIDTGPGYLSEALSVAAGVSPLGSSPPREASRDGTRADAQLGRNAIMTKCPLRASS